MRTYHGLHIFDSDRDSVLEGLDHFFFHRYYSRRGIACAPSADEPDSSWRLAVSDRLDGWVSVYDEGENFRRANRVGKTISAYLRRPVLWLGLFEDLDFYYQLYSDGDPIDAYDSDPSIFDPEEGFLEDPDGTGWLPADFTGVNRDRNLAVLGNPDAFFAILPDEDGSRAMKLQSLLSRGRAYHGAGMPDFEELSWADDGVALVAQLIGVAPARATTGFDVLETDGVLPGWVQPISYRKVATAGSVRKRAREVAC